MSTQGVNKHDPAQALQMADELRDGDTRRDLTYWCDRRDGGEACALVECYRMPDGDVLLYAPATAMSAEPYAAWLSVWPTDKPIVHLLWCEHVKLWTTPAIIEDDLTGEKDYRVVPYLGYPPGLIRKRP